MAKKVKRPVRKAKEIRIAIPKGLEEYFKLNPRVVPKLPFPPGIWPIDAKILRRLDLNKLINNREFNKNYQVVITHKR